MTWPHPTPPRRTAPVAASALIAALLVGCALPVDRAASFQPYASLTVHAVPFPHYVSLRTALLCQGTAAFERAGHDRVNFRLDPDSAYGLATAIAADGYFVTAAHCADGQLTLLFAADHDLWSATARVVARGTPGKADVAVLKIDHPLAGVFPWAGDETVRVDLPVVGVGAGLEDTPPRQTECMAGRITAVGPRTVGPVIASRIDTDLPARPGDSGGGVVTVAGQLVAVIVGGNARTHRCDAVRPDPAWLTDVVARDRRAHPTADPAGRWSAHRVAATAPATRAN